MNISQAKQISLEQVLMLLGHEPVRRKGNDVWFLSPLRKESTASFKVNRALNVWIDFGDGKRGDVIDLMQEVYRETDVSKSLERLSGLMRGCAPEINRLESYETSSPSKVLSVLPIRSKALRSYLESRRIDGELASSYLKEVHYESHGKRYFALGLANQSDGFEVRNRYFKGTVGPKDLSVIPGKGSTVFVFEGMMDFLTAAQMFDGQLIGTAIVMNSVALKEKAAEVIRRMGPVSVALYRDNDAAGEALQDFFDKQLPKTSVVDWSSLYVGYKDLNDWFSCQKAKTR